MKLSTLCYIEKDRHYLMLHRVKKKVDVNKNKWIGVGGKFETNESPDDCLLREVKEETGLELTSFAYRGILTFIYNNMEPEFIHVYTADGFTGQIPGLSHGSQEESQEESHEAGRSDGSDGSGMTIPDGDASVVTDAAAEVDTSARIDAATDVDIDAAAEVDTPEGILRWVSFDDIPALDLWEGDRIFLKLLMEGGPAFSLKLEYHDDELIAATLNGRRL